EDANANEAIVARELGKLAARVGGRIETREVADEIDLVAVARESREVRERAVQLRRRRRAARLGAAGRERVVRLRDATKQPDDRAGMAARPHERFATVLEHEPADAVAAVDCMPREQCCDLGCRNRLRAYPAAEEHRTALIDQDQRRTLALLAIDLR